MTERDLDPEQDPTYAAAADWLARLQDPDLSLEETLAWQQWIAHHPLHGSAFHELEELWEKFGSVPTPQPVSRDAIHLDRYDGSVSVSTWRARLPIVPLRRPSRLALAAMLLIAVLGVVAGSLRLGPWLAGLPHTRTFETAVGENAAVHLADGSAVQLGGHTRLRVLITKNLREIELLGGEACFQVAKDRTRPFVVHAGNATVTAVGTEFNVRRSDDRVVVSVLEGRVLVQPITPVVPVSWLPVPTRTGSPAPVRAGQRTTVDHRGIESTQAVVDAANAVAWEHGRLAFEAEPLRYVIQDVNRYADKPIVIADSRMGELRVTGTVTEDNIVGWVNSLQTAFGIDADIQPDRIVLRPNR